MSDRPRQIWELQPDEPPKLYQLFLVYRTMPFEKRSVRALSEKLKVDTVKLQKAATKFSWTFRADQWEAWRAKLQNRALENAEQRRVVNETEAIYNMAQVALLQTKRLLRKMQRTKEKVPVLDKAGLPVLDDDGKQKMKENQEWTLGASTIMDIVRETTSLVRLIRGEPGSQDETERKQQREQLFAKLNKIANAVSGGGEGSA
jgi:hypothetical protein